jgi:hypothetical protein
VNATKLYGLPTVFGFGYYPKVRLRAQYGSRRHSQLPVAVAMRILTREEAVLSALSMS